MSSLVGFLKLIRWSNLLMLFSAQFLFYFIVFPNTNVVTETNLLQFLLLTSATIFIAAGGYIINDFFDIECDKINKPKKLFIPSVLSKKNALIAYIFTSLLGLTMGSFLSINQNKPLLILIFIGIIISLFFYSKTFQKLPLLGNLLISVLVATNTFIILLLIDSYAISSFGIKLLLQFSFLAFFINLLREIVKDIQDIKGDYNSKMKTLPIVIGIDRTKKTIYFLSIIPSYLMIRFCLDTLQNNIAAQACYFLTILIPLGFFFLKLKKSKTNKQFDFLNKLLKGILIFGLILIFFIIY